MASYLHDADRHRPYKELYRSREVRRPYSAFGASTYHRTEERGRLSSRTPHETRELYSENSKLHRDLQIAKQETETMEMRMNQMESRMNCIKVFHEEKVKDLQFGLSRAREKHSILRSTIRRLEEELVEKRSTIRDMKLEISRKTEREEEMRQLQRKTDEQSRTISALASKVVQLTKTKGELEKELVAKQWTIYDMEKEISRQKDREEKMKQLKRKTDEQSHFIYSLESEVIQLTNHLEAKDTLIRTLNQENFNIKSGYKESFESRQLRAENTGLKGEMRQLRRNANDYNLRSNERENKIKALERKLERLKDCSLEVLSLKDENRQLNNKILKLEVAEKNSIRQISELEGRLEEQRKAAHVPWEQHVREDVKKTDNYDQGQHLPVTDDIKSEIWKKEGEIRGLKRELQKEKQALEAANDQIRKLNENLLEAKEKIKELEARLKTQPVTERREREKENKTRGLTVGVKSRDREDDFTHKIRDLEEKLSKTKTENYTLLEQLEEAKRQNKIHIRRIESLEREKTEFKFKSNEALLNLEKKETEAKDFLVLKFENQDLKKKIDKLEKAAEDADKRADKYEEEQRRRRQQQEETNTEVKEIERENQCLLSKIARLESEAEELRRDINNLQNTNIEAVNRADRYEEEQRRRRQQQEKTNTEVKEIERENQFLLSKVARTESEAEELRRDINNLQNTNIEAVNRTRDLEKKERDIRIDYQKAEASLKEYEQEVKQLKREKADVVKRVEELEMDKNQIQQHQEWFDAELAKKDAEILYLNDSIKKLSSEKLRIMHDRDEMEKAKDDALTRLSKAAGAKLTQGNAAITDLSDDNRPTKIAEKFSELYDNLWTDAYEELSDQGLDDLRVIDLLLQILKDAYQTCMQKEKIYDSTITEAVHSMPTMKDGVSDRTSGSGSSTIPTNVQIRKAIVDIKLALGPTAGSKIAELNMPRLEESLRGSIPTFRCSSFPKTTEYGRQCAILCWLMRIRDPSVHIDFSFTTDTRFDGDFYRQYTKSGSRADYLVWPILYLHERGPLLAKGVAQPK